MKPVNDKPLTRRVMLRTVGGFVALLAGCNGIGQLPGDGNGNGNGGGDNSPVTAFRRSGRGRRVSNAAKLHNANHLYTTSATALADAAHPGDRSKVVQVILSRARFDQLFGAGNLSVDLRHV